MVVLLIFVFWQKEYCKVIKIAGITTHFYLFSNSTLLIIRKIKFLYHIITFKYFVFLFWQISRKWWLQLDHEGKSLCNNSALYEWTSRFSIPSLVFLGIFLCRCRWGKWIVHRATSRFLDRMGICLASWVFRLPSPVAYCWVVSLLTLQCSSSMTRKYLSQWYRKLTTGMKTYSPPHWATEEWRVDVFEWVSDVAWCY